MNDNNNGDCLPEVEDAEVRSDCDCDRILVGMNTNQGRGNLNVFVVFSRFNLSVVHDQTPMKEGKVGYSVLGFLSVIWMKRGLGCGHFGAGFEYMAGLSPDPEEPNEPILIRSG